MRFFTRRRSSLLKSWLDRFHLFLSDQEWVLFVPETFASIRLNASIGNVLKLAKEGKSNEDISEELGIDEESIALAQEKIQKIVEGKIDVSGVSFPDRPPTVYLNIANACNLRCVYCYADCGTYNSKAGLMDETTAFTAVDRFFDQHSAIGSIVFFGGEPMLHESLIPPVCDYAEKKAKEKGVDCPRFSIVTNGTLLNEKNVRFLGERRFSVTVSLDGPEVVNDVLRPDAQGKGTFEKVAKGLRLLQKEDVHLNIESTFTSKHISQGITPKQLLEFFRDEYGVRTITISPVASTPGDEVGIHDYYQKLIPFYREAARFSLETMLTDRPIILLQINEILRHVLTRTKKPQNQFCYTKLGQKLFTVSTEGKVFPCQMMTDRDEYEMGSVFDEKLSEGKKFKEVQQVFVEMNKQKLACQNCWAQHVCFMCIAGVEIETKKLAPIPEYRCDMIRGLVEEVLSFISQLQEDESQMKKFVDTFFRR